MPRATWDNLDERRRERVLHAAMAEFGRRGYSGGSLNVIAREAGVAKGSLFQYFEDKFDFFAHVAEQTSLTVYAAMTPLLCGPEVEETFLHYFGRLVAAWMDYMAVHPLERAVTAATAAVSMNFPAISFLVASRAKQPTYSLEKSMCR